MILGWIKLNRSLLEWEWYDDLNVRILFLHLLLTVNYEDKKWRGLLIKKGSRITGRIQLAKESGISEQNVRTALKKLTLTNELTIKNNPQGSMFTINNWNKYQTLTRDQPPNQPDANQTLTRDQPETNQRLTTTKEVNNIKKERNKEERDTSPYQLIEQEKTSQLETWLMQNKKQVHNFKDLVDAFNNTANLEILSDSKPLEFKSDMLILRFKNFARSWIGNQKRFEKEKKVAPKKENAGIALQRQMGLIK